MKILKKIVYTDILLCNKFPVDKNIILRAQRLSYIGTFSTGYNNLDIEFCKQNNITVCNAGSYSSNSVAQQTMAYILNHFTKVCEYDKYVKAGGCQKSPVFSPIVFNTHEVSGKTLGIIGYVNIGKTVSKLAQTFGINILVNTRTPKKDENVTFVSFKELLSNSDVITAHCPLNSASEGMFNSEAFSQFKK